MTNNGDDQALVGAQVELTAPDGRVFRFHVSALVPYAGETYAVLEHEGADGQLLVTHVETDADGAPVFVVCGEEDIISSVLEKQVAQTIARAMAQAPEQDADDGPEDCCCSHEGHEACDCGHAHREHVDHSAHQHPCDCGCHSQRPVPSYIRRQGQ